MIEYYDVIIVGAGIAGSGLAYNLKRFGYDGSVLILDKNKPGANAAYGYRNTFKEIIDEYKIPYEHKYKRIILGPHKDPAKLDINTYFINYLHACSYLIQNSNAVFKKDHVIDVKKRTIITENREYIFKYLIDCSGASFFLRKKFNLPISYRYWVGEVGTVKDSKNLKEFSDEDYFHLFDDKGYLEDLYRLKDKIIIGRWQYTKDYNFSQEIKTPKNSLFDMISKQNDILDLKRVMIPCTPALPLVINNYAFLGDSFGNATTTSGEGIRTTLKTSEILALAINKGSLKYYEKTWLDENLKTYLSKLAPKLNANLKIKIFRAFKSKPDLLCSIMKNEIVDLPKEITKKIPMPVKLIIMRNYLYLKIKYFLSLKGLVRIV